MRCISGGNWLIFAKCCDVYEMAMVSDVVRVASTVLTRFHTLSTNATTMTNINDHLMTVRYSSPVRCVFIRVIILHSLMLGLRLTADNCNMCISIINSESSQRHLEERQPHSLG